MSRARRIVVVTAGLAATGAVVGALVGVLALFLGSLVRAGWAAASDPFGYAIAAIIGAAIGAVVAPILAWGVMRHVPLGRAIAGTALGAVLGGAIGWVLPVVFPPFAAVAGFVVAAVVLRLTARRTAAAAPREPA